MPKQITVEKLLYTKQEAAYALARSVRAIEYMMSLKKIDFRRAGARVLIPASEVRRVAATSDYTRYSGSQKPASLDASK